LAEGAHHEVAPYSLSQLEKIAAQDGLYVEAKMEWNDYTRSAWMDDYAIISAIKFRDVPGTFVTDHSATTHVSMGFRHTLAVMYDLDDRGRIEPGHREERTQPHFFNDLIAISQAWERHAGQPQSHEPERAQAQPISKALSRLISACERAIGAEQDFDADDKISCRQHYDKLRWIEPMKKAMAEVRAEAGPSPIEQAARSLCEAAQKLGHTVAAALPALFKTIEAALPGAAKELTDKSHQEIEPPADKSRDRSIEL
jgi:hypothetical protein